MSVNRILVSATLLLLCGCQAPMQAGSQCTVEPGYLSGISEFMWRSDPAVDVQDETGYVSPIAIQSLRDAVTQQLNREGFELVDRKRSTITQHQLEVSLTLRTRRELVAFETHENPCVNNDCWERIDPGSSTRMEMRTVGFLAADVYLAGDAIWRGWVETTLYPIDRDASNQVIARAVPKLFETFPP